MSEQQQTGVLVLPPSGGTSVQRSGFGGTELERRHETQSSALAARAKAEIEARWIVAMRQPRSWDKVRLDLLRECERPGFAESAMFSIKRGRKKNEATGRWEDNMVEGLTIRFAEAAMRSMGNLSAEPTVVYDDNDKRIVRVTVMDLESNVTYVEEFVMRKVVERKELREGQASLGERFNAYGDRVHLVEATDDDVAQKQAVLASKAIRNSVLRLLPGDYRDDCIRRIAETKTAVVNKDPDKAKRDILEAFHRLGVGPDAIATYLGHPLEQTTPAELVELRGIFAAVREGEASWSDVLSAREGEGDGKGKPSPAAAKLRERIEAQKKRAAAPAPKPEGDDDAQVDAPKAEAKGAPAAKPEKPAEAKSASVPDETRPAAAAAKPAAKPSRKTKAPPAPAPDDDDEDGPDTCADCGVPTEPGEPLCEGCRS
jgi:hypothetical protein